MTENFRLTSSDIPISNAMAQDNLGGETLDLGVVKPNVELDMEGEEDEVIVFKPTVAVKPAVVVAPNWTSYEVLKSAENTSREWGSYIGSVSAPSNNLCLQSALDLRLPASFASIVPQQLQPFNVSASKWLVEQQDSLANGVKNLGLVANGLVWEHKLKKGFDGSQPPVLSLPLSQSVNITSGSVLSGQKNASEVEIPSKFDSIMSSLVRRKC